MHLIMIGIVLALSWMGRLLWVHGSASLPPNSPSAHRAGMPSAGMPTLAAFLCPPLLLGMTAIAILCMGHHGHMMGSSVSLISCWIAGSWCGYNLVVLLQSLWQAWRSHQTLRRYPAVTLLPATFSRARTLPAQMSARVLDSDSFFAAQVGIWRSQLLLSRSLLTQLSPEQLEAVLLHEQAHANYGDCFWFFWLNWLRRTTTWIPGTETLWQELIMLREVRADHRAAQVVEPLVLAETLLSVSVQSLVQSRVANHLAAATLPPSLQGILQGSQSAGLPQGEPLNGAIAGCTSALQRLDIRVEALLAYQNQAAVSHTSRFQDCGMSWLTLASSCTPLLTIALHH